MVEAPGSCPPGSTSGLREPSTCVSVPFSLAYRFSGTASLPAASTVSLRSSGPVRSP